MLWCSKLLSRIVCLKCLLLFSCNKSWYRKLYLTPPKQVSTYEWISRFKDFLILINVNTSSWFLYLRNIWCYWDINSYHQLTYKMFILSRYWILINYSVVNSCGPTRCVVNKSVFFDAPSPSISYLLTYILL